MFYIALALALAVSVIAVVLGNLLRIVIRQGARERERLIDQVCHLSGRPWHQAPAWEPADELERELLLSTPEQHPDY